MSVPYAAEATNPWAWPSPANRLPAARRPACDIAIRQVPDAQSICYPQARRQVRLTARHLPGGDGPPRLRRFGAVRGRVARTRPRLAADAPQVSGLFARAREPAGDLLVPSACYSADR